MNQIILNQSKNLKRIKYFDLVCKAEIKIFAAKLLFYNFDLFNIAIKKSNKNNKFDKYTQIPISKKEKSSLSLSLYIYIYIYIVCNIR